MKTKSINTIVTTNDIGTLSSSTASIVYSNGLTLDLDNITSINLIYRNNSYTVDKETLISLLFNYEDIVRNIVKEELEIYE